MSDLPRGPLLEFCVDSVETARGAAAAGADRIELCGPSLGGVTPERALLHAVLAAVTRPVHVMIRPREGNFVYHEAEFEQMLGATLEAKQAGAAGVVFGVLHADGTIDAVRMAQLIREARPLRVACHRAFDATPDADAALQTLLGLGVEIVLTAGHAPTALDGAAVLARHQRTAGTRLEILAGGGVRAANVHALLAASGVRAVHARGLDPDVVRALAAALGRLP